MIKIKMAFLEGRPFSSQSELFDNFSIALIGQIKVGPPKSHLYFDYVNRLLMLFPILGPSSGLPVVGGPADMQTEQLLCWSGMTNTERSTTFGSNEEL